MRRRHRGDQRNIANREHTHPMAHRKGEHVGPSRELRRDLGQNTLRARVTLILQFHDAAAVIVIAYDPAEHDPTTRTGMLDSRLVKLSRQRLIRNGDQPYHLIDVVGRHTPPPAW
jgi:hypothetical protein